MQSQPESNINYNYEIEFLVDTGALILIRNLRSWKVLCGHLIYNSAPIGTATQEPT